MNNTEQREQNRQSQRVAEHRYTLAKITQFIWFFTGILEALIGIRVLLKLIAANPNAGFAQFIYTLTTPFLVAFFGLTATPSTSGAVLEIPSLVAMLVYVLVAWGIIRLLWLLFDRPPSRPGSAGEQHLAQ